MNQALSVYTSPRRYRFVILLQLALVVVFTLVVACSSGPTLGTSIEAPLSGAAVVTCSESCAARGQCGTTADGQQAVFGASYGADTVNHDRLFFSGTPVNIAGSEIRTIQSLNNLEQLAQLPFYLLVTQDNTKSGWVAGWCVAAP